VIGSRPSSSRTEATMSATSEQRFEEKRVGVQVSVKVVVTDREALLAYVKRRYAASWFDTEWEPADLPEAVLEALVVSNENPSPDEYGIEILKTEVVEVPAD
jgi:hypothetical protein